MKWAVNIRKASVASFVQLNFESVISYQTVKCQRTHNKCVSSRNIDFQGT